MLVLTRRHGEEIVIGGNIRAKVVAIKGLSARIGITAPPSVLVLRLELLAAHHDRDSVPDAADGPRAPS
jgi:carbon storage regulator